MAEQSAVTESRTNEDFDDPTGRPSKTSSRRFIVLALVLLLIVGAGFYWWHSTFYEDTDDAQVNGHLIQISSRIAGQVSKVYVEENQYVEKGAILAEIDPSDFNVTVKADEAALASARANFEAAQVNIPLTGINTGSTLSSASADVSGAQASVQQANRQLDAARARVAQAKANSVKADLDLQRYRPLVEKDIISKQQFDAAVAAADSARAAVLDAQSTEQAAGQGIKIAQDRVVQSQSQFKNAQTGPDQIKIQRAKADQASAQVQQAEATLDQAKLNLAYSKIIAPVSGIITKKNLEMNQNVSVGQNMMTLVSLEDVWITANFKETQLRMMRPGQAVAIKVDASGRTYDGKVTQIGGATGSVLSLFPPENATGNYVKVVQRVPVRIDLTNPDEDRDHLLRPGLSVEPRVRVKQ